MPNNTPAGIYIAAFAFFLGFGFVWHLIWMSALAFVGIIVVFVIRAFKEDSEYILPAAEVKKLEEARAETLLSHKKEYLDARDEEEMGVMDFAKYVYAWALDILRNKKWKTW
jgi:hypothetical protein